MAPQVSVPSQIRQALAAQLQTAREVALLAVGSELRGDDAVALRIAELVQESREQSQRLSVFIGATAPENCTGPIRRLNPSHLLVIDAADLGAAPGSLALLQMRDLAGVTFCTHVLPLSVILEYIVRSCPDCQVVVLGVQPDRLDFAAPLTPAVEDAAQQIADMIRCALAN